MSHTFRLNNTFQCAGEDSLALESIMPSSPSTPTPLSTHKNSPLSSSSSSLKSSHSSSPSTPSPLIKYIDSYSWPLAISLLSSPSNHHFVSIRSPHGELPLHMALKRSAPEQLLLTLISLNPDAVHQTGETDCSLPLHIATVRSLPPRVIITILRKFPEALDIEDEDGDTPRMLVRKDLDELARDAIMKPTLYWTSLLDEFRRDALLGARKETSIYVKDLKKRAEDAERELSVAKKNEAVLLEKLHMLESKIVQLEANKQTPSQRNLTPQQRSSSSRRTSLCSSSTSSSRKCSRSSSRGSLTGSPVVTGVNEAEAQRRISATLLNFEPSVLSYIKTT